MNKITVIFLTTVFGVVFSADRIPSDLQKCKATDAKCFEEQFNFALKNYKQGIPSLGVPQIDPLKIDKIQISENTQGKARRPISLDMEFKDIDVKGFSECKASNYKGLDIQKILKDHKSTSELTLKGSKLKLVGQYKIKGHVLILPIEGAGDCELSMDNVFIKINFTQALFEKNGKQYVRITKPNIVLKLKKLELRFENLFNGDKRLSKQMNTFLNDNWKDILEELKPAIIETFGGTFIQIINNVFTNIPLDELFKYE